MSDSHVVALHCGTEGAPEEQSQAVVGDEGCVLELGQKDFGILVQLLGRIEGCALEIVRRGGRHAQTDVDRYAIETIATKARQASDLLRSAIIVLQDRGDGETPF